MIKSETASGGRERRPTFGQAAKGVIEARTEVLAAQGKVALDIQEIYSTLARELLEEKIAAATIASRHGITLPTDAGITAIEKLKAKFFGKMNKNQVVNSFANITTRIAQRRRDDPDYIKSPDYRKDGYILKALVERMKDTRYLDDPQGIPEAQILSDIKSATGTDASEYAEHLESYSNSDRSRSAQANSGSKRALDLNGILNDSLKREAFKSILSKIGLTADLLSSYMGPADIENMLTQITRGLTSFDLNPAGISVDELRAFIGNLSSASPSVINNLKSIVS